MSTATIATTTTPAAELRTFSTAESLHVLHMQQDEDYVQCVCAHVVSINRPVTSQVSTLPDQWEVFILVACMALKPNELSGYCTPQARRSRLTANIVYVYSFQATYVVINQWMLAADVSCRPALISKMLRSQQVENSYLQLKLDRGRPF